MWSPALHRGRSPVTSMSRVGVGSQIDTPNSRNSRGLGPGGHGTVRRERCLSTHSPADERPNARGSELLSCKGLVAVRQQCERLEGVESEADPHQKATKPGPPQTLSHLVAQGTCPNQVPIQTDRLKLGCGIAGAVTPFPRESARHPPVCGSKYRYLVGSPESALQVMLIRRPRPSGPSGILTRTPVKPTQPTQAQTGIYRAACKVATSALTTCLHSPLAALNSTTWIRDHKSHLPRHNKYTSPQNQSTCPLGLPHRVPVVSPLVPRLPDSIEVAPGRGQSDLFVGTTHPPSTSPSPNAQAAGSIPFLC